MESEAASKAQLHALLGSAKAEHPSLEQLERFMRSELARERARAVVRHMLTDCPRCVAVTRRYWNRGERSPRLEALLREMVAEADARGVSVHDEPGLI